MTLTNKVGKVQVGSRTFTNGWVPEGTILHQVNCLLCLDGGRVVDDNHQPTDEYCDCDRGLSQREYDDDDRCGQ